MWEVLETMRVISQHGNVDLPYEQLVVCHAMESVIALFNGEEYVLGKYSSKEKAYKAMEMLKRVYENNMFYHCMANTKRFECGTISESYNRVFSIPTG